jgi:hypothetical protein
MQARVVARIRSEEFRECTLQARMILTRAMKQSRGQCVNPLSVALPVLHRDFSAELWVTEAIHAMTNRVVVGHDGESAAIERAMRLNAAINLLPSKVRR